MASMRARVCCVVVSLLLAAGCGSDEESGKSSGTGATGGGGSGGSSSGGGGSGGSTGGSGGVAGSGGSPGDASGGAAGGGGTAGSGGAAGGSSFFQWPAERLDLSNWKLTLPVSKAGSTGLWEVLQPELATFSIDPWFRLSTAKDGVLFRAHAGGVTTSNSGYPRSELREMKDQGVNKASWSTTSGTHTMTIRQAIVHLPVAKPHVVAGQIHDASDDVVMIRLEGTKLFVEGGGNALGVLDGSYSLGKAFTVKLQASGGKIRIYHEDMTTPKLEVSRSTDGCYFKAGVYTQSNTSTGDKADAYGEVVIFDLLVTHQ